MYLTFWIEVHKARYLRRYQLTGANEVVSVATSTELTWGGEVDLGQITVGGQTWWSLCFEVFGPATSLEGTLRLVAEAVLSSLEPPRLEASHSCGYPAWVRQVTGSID